jgi:hypothetical protein
MFRNTLYLYSTDTCMGSPDHGTTLRARYAQYSSARPISPTLAPNYHLPGKPGRPPPKHSLPCPVPPLSSYAAMDSTSTTDSTIAKTSTHTPLPHTKAKPKKKKPLDPNLFHLPPVKRLKARRRNEECGLAWTPFLSVCCTSTEHNIHVVWSSLARTQILWFRLRTAQQRFPANVSSFPMLQCLLSCLMLSSVPLYSAS